MPFLVESKEGVDLFSAAKGDSFESKVGPNMELRQFIVGPKCDGAANAGRWFCTTHDYVPQHNWDKDQHISKRGTHVLAWICLQHGPEVP